MHFGRAIFLAVIVGYRTQIFRINMVSDRSLRFLAVSKLGDCPSDFFQNYRFIYSYNSELRLLDGAAELDVHSIVENSFHLGWVCVLLQSTLLARDFLLHAPVIARRQRLSSIPISFCLIERASFSRSLFCRIVRSSCDGHRGSPGVSRHPRFITATF